MKYLYSKCIGIYGRKCSTLYLAQIETAAWQEEDWLESRMVNRVSRQQPEK